MCVPVHVKKWEQQAEKRVMIRFPLRYRVGEVVDGAQMASINGMRAVLPHLTQRDSRQGPFSLTLTDLHQSNINGYEDWHIKYLTDLASACFLPIQMQIPPFWLTSRGVNQLREQYLAEYEQVLEEDSWRLVNTWRCYRITAILR